MQDAVARYLRPGTLQLGGVPPLALYVHLPWCLRKCPYCDFNSHALRPDERVPGADEERRFEAYLDALRADLEASLPLVWGRPVSTVFIGGGTPSLFDPGQIDRLLAEVRALLRLEPGCEVTLEANPGTFERDRFRGFRDAGVTRLSVGVQSFDDEALVRLGRVHSAAQARAALEEAASAFDTWNLDLMYALPDQSLDDLGRELDAAMSFDPPHLSIYHLTLEPNTVFASRPPENLPDEDTAAEMLDLIVERSAAAGLSRYEVSAYSQPGHRCRHNLNYWAFGDYLGIGAGAHSKLSFPHRVVRQVRWRDPARYQTMALQGQPVAQDEEVPRQRLPFEYVMNALRLPEGFELSRFRERTGLPPSVLEAPLAEAQARGLIERDLVRVQPTPRGFDFLNDLLALFLPDERDAAKGGPAA